MYCSSCGVAVAQGLSYCNYCGAKLTAEKGDHAVKSSEVKPESLVWGMVAVLVFGFVAVIFLLMAMKVAGIPLGLMLAFTTLSFLIMLLVEGVFTWQLFRGKRGGEESGDTVLLKGQSTNDLDAAHPRVLPEPMPSVTEHTTRAFEPTYSERKSK